MINPDPKCLCTKLRSISRAVKAMALSAGPLGLRPRNWTLIQRTVLGYKSEAPVQRGRALDRRTETVEWIAEIEGVGSAISQSEDVLLDDLGKKVKGAKS